MKSVLTCHRAKTRAFFCALALVLSVFASQAFSQPPEGDFPGGFPGDFPGGQEMGPRNGGRGGRAGRGARDGAEQKDGQKDQDKEGKDKEKETPQLSLAESLKKADGKGVLLNQKDFKTSDGVQLVANFYRKGDRNPEAPVVVMLHDIKGQKEDFAPLAEALANEGCVVLVPDLRGRGGSEKARPFVMNNNPPNDQMKDFAGVTSDDVEAMKTTDCELWFNFLFYLHNEGYCNVKKTIIIGSEFGAALAASWAKDDWNIKGEYGQNVVGLVLFSPDVVSDKKKKDKDDDGVKYDVLNSLLEIRKKAKDPVFGLMVVTGQMDEDKLAAAKQIQLKIGGKADADAPVEDKKCPIDAIQTEKQGTDLLKYEAFGVQQTVVQYVAQRLNKLPNKRQERKEFSDAESSAKEKEKESKSSKSGKSSKGSKKSKSDE